MSRIGLFAALAAGTLFTVAPTLAEETSPGTNRRIQSERYRYDAVGRLQSNKGAQAKRGMQIPPYVLVDKSGAPRCYVTPDAGVDVSDLVNLRVGVRGSVRSVEGDPLPHIVARRVRAVADPHSPATARQRDDDDGVITAANLEPIPAGMEDLPAPQPHYDAGVNGQPEMIDGGQMMGDGGQMMGDGGDGSVYFDDPGNQWQGGPGGGQGFQGGCGGLGCGRCMSCCNANDPGPWWVRKELLYWATSGMSLPPLVTTSPVGTDRTDAGVLGVDGTQTIFGGNSVNNDARLGGRIQFGRWLDNCQTWGISGEYFALQNQTTDYSATSTGNPILARPFYDALNGQNTSELVAFPNVIEGTVSAHAATAFQGAGALLRYNICCKNMCFKDCCDPCNGVPGGIRVGVVGGYRFMKLDDYLSIREDLTSLDTENPGSFALRDHFTTHNVFNGAEVGMVVEGRKGRWTLDLVSKMALGNNHETTIINGRSTITENNVAQTYTGGLLAQRTNIGTYSRDQFAVIPQLAANLGFNVTQNTRLIVGYTFIYWSRVARAGDQVSLDVNPNLIPPEANPFSGPLRPQFTWRDTDFWAQGVSIGFDHRF